MEEGRKSQATCAPWWLGYRGRFLLRSHLGEVRQSGKVLWVAKVPHPDVHRRCGLVGLRVAHKEGFQAVFQSKEPVLDVLLHVARPHHGLRVQHEALGTLHLPHVHHTLLHRAAQTFRVRRHIASGPAHYTRRFSLSLSPKKKVQKKGIQFSPGSGPDELDGSRW